MWNGRPRRRLADSARWLPGWRGRAGSEWCGDRRRLRVSVWRRRAVASADERFLQYRPGVRLPGTPGRWLSTRWVGSDLRRGTANHWAAGIANSSAEAPAASPARGLAGLCALLRGEFNT